jgi:hypothetical protein
MRDKMKQKHAKASRRFITGLLPIIVISLLVIPSVNAWDFGYTWVYDNDPYLKNTKPDAEGFADRLLKDGWRKTFGTSEGNAHDEQWEESQDQYYVDNAHIAYYAGHGWPTKLLIHKKNNPAGRPPEYAEWWKCKWGNENGRKNNWVCLACCYAGKWWFGYSLRGAHLVLGWMTKCKDEVYGPTFGDYLIQDELTLKSAWFQTGKELGESGHKMRVLGETISMGKDHLPGHGYVSPDPYDNSVFVYWTCKVP